MSTSKRFGRLSKTPITGRKVDVGLFRRKLQKAIAQGKRFDDEAEDRPVARCIVRGKVVRS